MQKKQIIDYMTIYKRNKKFSKSNITTLMLQYYSIKRGLYGNFKAV